MIERQPFGKRRKLPPVTIGARFHRLVIIADAAPPEWITRPKSRRARWVEILCDCGTKKVVLACTIARGDVHSCGCKLRENREEYTRKHSPALRRAAVGRKIPNPSLSADGQPIG